MEELAPDGDVLPFKASCQTIKDAQDKPMTWQSQFDDLLMHLKVCEEEGTIPLIDEHAFYLSKIIDPNGFVIPKYITEKVVLTDTMLDLGPSAAPASSKNDLSEVNPTFFPDRVWSSFTPIFLVRHPARTVLSVARVLRKIVPNYPFDSPRLNFSNHYRVPREIFDAYVKLYGSQGSSKYPLVLDGTDLVNNPEETMTKVCHALAINPSKISYHWEPVTVSIGPIPDAFLGTLWGSSGVKKSQTPLADMPDIDQEGLKWKEEFGEKDGEHLIRLAHSFMPDFEYLWQFRV